MVFSTNVVIITGVVIGLILAVFINTGFFLYLFKKKYEKNILKGAIDLINKVDKIENKIGSGNMEETKKLAKYIGKKIDDMKEELKAELEEINDNISELQDIIINDESAELDEEQEENEEDEDEFSEFEESEGEEEQEEEEDIEKTKKPKAKEEEKEEENIDGLDDEIEIDTDKPKEEYRGARSIKISEEEEKLSKAEELRKRKKEDLKKKKKWFGKSKEE